MGRYFMANFILLRSDSLLLIKITSEDSGRFFMIIIIYFYYNYYNYYYTYTVLEDVIIAELRAREARLRSTMGK